MGDIELLFEDGQTISQLYLYDSYGHLHIAVLRMRSCEPLARLGDWSMVFGEMLCSMMSRRCPSRDLRHRPLGYSIMTLLSHFTTIAPTAFCDHVLANTDFFLSNKTSIVSFDARWTSG